MDSKKTITLHYDKEATKEDTFRFRIEKSGLTQEECYDIIDLVKLEFGLGIYYAAETYRIDENDNPVNFEPGMSFNPTEYRIGGILTNVEDPKVVLYISELLRDKGFEVQSCLVNGQKSDFLTTQNSTQTLDQHPNP
jgi:hypothetical protein